MARPSLPTLTWNNSSVTEIANATPVLILTALKALIAASTHWEVESDALTGAFLYVEAKPKSAVAGVTDQRIVYAANGSSTFNANVMGPGTTTATKSTLPGTGDLIALSAPEGGTGTKVASFPDDAAGNSIYGAVRTMGYYGMLDNAIGTYTAKVWLIESAEVLNIAIENSTGNAEYGCCHGPMWVGASTAAQDVDATDRIYGGSWHPTTSSASFWTVDNNCWGDTSSGAFATMRTLCFDPDTETETYALRYFKYGIAIDTFNLVSKAGTYIGMDVNYYAYETRGLGTLVPDEYIGTLRQMRTGRDFPSRVAIQDGASATVAIVRGAHPTNNAAAMWFTNS